MNSLCTVETAHDDMIHDSQFDYYSTKLATCSSDRTIKVFDVKDDTYHNSATLKGHEGPVWQVAWAHPKFGVLLASCSYDGSVIIHKESPQNQWSPIYEHKFHFIIRKRTINVILNFRFISHFSLVVSTKYSFE